MTNRRRRDKHPAKGAKELKSGLLVWEKGGAVVNGLVGLLSDSNQVGGKLLELVHGRFLALDTSNEDLAQLSKSLAA